MLKPHTFKNARLVLPDSIVRGTTRVIASAPRIVAA